MGRYILQIFNKHTLGNEITSRKHDRAMNSPFKPTFI